MISLLALLAPALAMAYVSELCLSGPTIDLEAGVSHVSAVIDDIADRRCMASLHFADPAFLPIAFSFDAFRCPGQHLNTFLVPDGVPDGKATVEWQCSGLTPVCTNAHLSGGGFNLSMELEQLGTVGCIIESLHTTTKLATVTSSSSTYTDTITTVLTATKTDYPSMTDGPRKAKTSFSIPTRPGGPKPPTSSQTIGPPSTSIPSPTNKIEAGESPTTKTATPKTTGSKPKEPSLYQTGQTTVTTPPVLPVIAISVISTVTVTFSTCTMT